MALLERIRRLDGTRASGDIRQSIFENVQRVCAARLGNAPACPQYGVPDSLHYSVNEPGGLAVIARTLRNALMACEPRLSAVRVEPVQNDDGTIHFLVTGQVATGARSRATIAFRTRFGPGAQLKVEG